MDGWRGGGLNHRRAIQRGPSVDLRQGVGVGVGALSDSEQGTALGQGAAPPGPAQPRCKRN